MIGVGPEREEGLRGRNRAERERVGKGRLEMER